MPANTPDCRSSIYPPTVVEPNYSGRPVGRDEPIKSKKGTRICVEPDCGTILSKYNFSSACTLHRSAPTRLTSRNARRQLPPVADQTKARSSRVAGKRAADEGQGQQARAKAVRRKR